MQYDVDEEGDGAVELQGRRPVMNLLPSSQGILHREGFVQVVRARCSTTLMRKAMVLPSSRALPSDERTAG
jgi:hypothetical protein